MGMSGLGRSSVSRRRRVPSPAPRTNACVIEGIALTIQHGGRNGLARQLVAMEKFRLVLLLRADCWRGHFHFHSRSPLRFPSDQEFQSVYPVPFGRADLYGAGTLSPNEK